ncbi:MAG: carbohydrate porin, partial [Gammaproteobacteria bacterium]|nr:carbohydrate porin [Gammaproteobacteria bacterium]
LKNDYERRLKALEERLRHAEHTAQQARTQAELAQSAASQTAAAPAPKAATSAGAFNPAVGVILNGSYGAFTRDPASYTIPGFALGPEAGPGERGFSLGESELNVNANVDDKFFGNLTAALTPGGNAEIEEAYFQTLGLPYGATLKAGRFFSAIGYLNSQHAHAWDFIDPPLPYRAMLDNQYFDDGVQLSWIVPADIFIQAGAEAFRGDHFPAGGAANRGTGTWSAFLHVGGDAGTSNSWLAGLSTLRAKADNRITGADSFTGNSYLIIADLVWKWAPNGNADVTHFKLQSEYFHRRENGLFNNEAYAGTQRGWYVQGIYQFMPRWRVGLRHDEVRAGPVAAAFNGTVLDNLGYTPKRDSVMVDFSNSEFSRFRLQYNRDRSFPQTAIQWYLQYIMSLGAHGAHTY